MEAVWKTVFKKRRHGKENEARYIYRARIYSSTVAELEREQADALRKIGGSNDDIEIHQNLAWYFEKFPAEDETRPEQDAAAVKVFREAFKKSLNIVPLYLPDLRNKGERLSSFALELQKISEELYSLGYDDEANVMRFYSGEITVLAQDLLPAKGEGRDDDEVRVVHRRVGDVPLRVYVFTLLKTTVRIFGTPLFGTVATLANVAFDTDSYSAESVRRLTRARP